MYRPEVRESLRVMLSSNLSLAEMELTVLTAAFFHRIDAKLDANMKPTEMEMVDAFASSPKGKKLVLNMKEIDCLS